MTGGSFRAARTPTPSAACGRRFRRPKNEPRHKCLLRRQTQSQRDCVHHQRLQAMVSTEQFLNLLGRPSFGWRRLPNRLNRAKAMTFEHGQGLRIWKSACVAEATSARRRPAIQPTWKSALRETVSKCAPCIGCTRTLFLPSPGESVARASSPASSGGVPPRESNPTSASSQRDAAGTRSRDGCATRTVSRCALLHLPP